MAKTPNVPAVKDAAALITQDDVSSFPQLSDDFLQASSGIGTGLENVTSKDVLIPRMTILQALSPQVTKGKPEYDEEARVGNIYDVGMSQQFGETVHILPLHYLVQWLEWAPRNTGKGLVKIWDAPPAPDLMTKNDRNQDIMKATGNLIQETAQIYALNLSAGGRASFIPMASTQLKKARKLITWATNERVAVNGQLVTPPLFYRSYILGTTPESNNEGNWIGWTVTPDKCITELPSWQARMRAVKEFREAIIRGEMRGDVGESVDAAASGIDQNGAM